MVEHYYKCYKKDKVKIKNKELPEKEAKQILS